MIPGTVGRPTWVEVDLDALRFNLRAVRRCVGPSVGVLAVVKANAYGHGAVPCARTLAAAGASALGVATVEEGAELRGAGIRVPVVVFGLAQTEEAPAVVRNRLQPTVVLPAQARALSRAATAARRRVSVHLKVDTGMGRIGVRPEAAGALARTLRRLPGVEVAGVFTHFAHADGRDRGLMRDQQARLETAAAAVRAVWPRVRVHAANSAAVIEAPATHYDLVRPGLMLYGLYPAPRLRGLVALRPVLRWVTRIIQVKTVPAGTGLSYGHTFVTRRPSRIATLPVGYADGLDRALSNRGRVLIGGRACPLVGRVCMDMCLADVTELPRAAVGDPAVLIGRQGRVGIGADELAAALGTISYEVLCAIGARVRRTYRGGTR